VMGITLEDLEKEGTYFGYYLQPLKSIHLNSNIQYEFEPNGNKALVYIFIVIAVLILLVACINFMNLATARASTRAREVGIRKLVGAHRSMIITQFLTESILLVILAFLVAILLVSWLLPSFSNMIQVKLNFGFMNSPFFLPLILLFILVTGLIAGSYPAFFLAAFRPAAVLKGSLQKGSKGKPLRSILVVLQIWVSIFILVGTFVTFAQMRYLLKKDPGFQRENVLVIRRSDVLKDKIESFKQELLKNPNILAVTNSNSIPGRTFSNNAIFVEGKGMENTYLTWQSWVSYDYEKVFDLKLAEGRFFSRDIPTDSSAAVINQVAIKSLGLEEPVIGKRLQSPTGPQTFQYHTIIGVLKDFHFKSLHIEIEPMTYLFIPGNWEGYIPVRLSGHDMEQTIAYVKKTWDSFTTEYPFDYFWMNEDYAKLYATEKKTSSVFIAFALMSMIIACLGMIGLVSYTAVQRTKEIGVRKAMGSSAGKIVYLFAKETGLFVVIAGILAFPIWFAAKEWLHNFAYHIDFTLLFFLLLLCGATLATLVIAFLSVGGIALSASMNNPAESLRYE
jgi:putative ABC transport system permease protein